MHWSSWVGPVSRSLCGLNFLIGLGAIRQISASAVGVLFDWWEEQQSKSLYMGRKSSRGAALFEAPPPRVSSLLLGGIIGLLARATGGLGWVYCNPIIQQLMSLGGPSSDCYGEAVYITVDLLCPFKAIKQAVRLLQSGFNFKQLLFGLKCLESETGGNYFVLTMEINILKCGSQPVWHSANC